MKYNITLKSYEGPLDLLYDLISKNKIDIYEISIAEITDQYINYIKEMEKMDLELTSEFIMMASRLVQMKSRYLLFKKSEEDQVDPRKELIETLIVYKQFKNASEFLKSRQNEGDKLFFRKKEELFEEEKIDLQNLNIQMLSSIFPTFIKKEIKKESSFPKVYKFQTISLEEQIDYVRFKVNKEGKLSFKELIKKETKEEIIVTFLSILELIKANEITVNQDTLFSDILIKKVE
ncbi:condensin subunit ScpA [Alkalithermobacter thermoalcaliphilus JW-YL-7 = DSM 7308]|uniref:Segregation and condensation protein A n=1 Tax=Alkalithermobacter thermoalcaliphilus JW-YL-7 = DSM 7308 TaxID=1121328 RepID=A0A150FSB2_CLOPD|nr:Segregation and condensation protein A [[Clostridium] paradoxum JW-YL-7 = DSM 7308]SHK77331.1 condensin subunit ScpA [[Clostridium] paradoxum JW-YL-7 = DSM 7308]